MEVRTSDGCLTAGGVLKIVTTGYLVGGGTLAFSVLAVLEIFGAAPSSPDGPLVKAIALLIAVPIIVGLQGLALGLLVAFGLWILQRGGRLRVVVVDAPTPSLQP
ncbi:MAG: hypothetical protein C0481_04620 [Phenylobacterium sp.]|uniref:hypothetical protein n=1 Tax=Phenylobacterium sp. TaxID=1871053 RepID=UPI0025F1A724|nr:hypothetical protein [Phenylobacterium sp.]MBA4011131.1 hypothetical protein [Phenylobacterium sp.]